MNHNTQNTHEIAYRVRTTRIADLAMNEVSAARAHIINNRLTYTLHTPFDLSSV